MLSCSLIMWNRINGIKKKTYNCTGKQPNSMK